MHVLVVEYFFGIYVLLFFGLFFWFLVFFFLLAQCVRQSKHRRRCQVPVLGELRVFFCRLPNGRRNEGGRWERVRGSGKGQTNVRQG